MKKGLEVKCEQYIYLIISIIRNSKPLIFLQLTILPAVENVNSLFLILMENWLK